MSIRISIIGIGAGVGGGRVMEQHLVSTSHHVPPSFFMCV
jgi:hypothetical protein